MLWFLGCLFVVVFALSWAPYILQHIYCAFFYRTQNLKKKYNAEWALVTGASSGTDRGGGVQLPRALYVTLSERSGCVSCCWGSRSLCRRRRRRRAPC